MTDGCALSLNNDVGKKRSCKASVFCGPLYTDAIRQKYMRDKHVSFLSSQNPMSWDRCWLFYEAFGIGPDRRRRVNRLQYEKSELQATKSNHFSS